jgi:heme/copper-type cytochrome/quinol oxidase subunit 2
MTLLDAQPYDPAKLQRRKIKIALTIVVVIVLAALAWFYRNWPEENTWLTSSLLPSSIRTSNPLTAFITTIPAGASISRSIPSTAMRISIAIGDRAGSGVLSNLTAFTDRRTQKISAAGGVVVEVIVNERIRARSHVRAEVR